MTKTIYTTLFILLVSTSTALLAEEELPPPASWSGTVQLGFTGTGGNSNDNNINSKFNLLYKNIKWTNSLRLESLFSNSDNNITAEKYTATAEINRAFKKKVFSFLRSENIFDRFSPYETTSTTSIGYGTNLYNSDKIIWDIQGGPGYRYADVNFSNETEHDLIGYLSTNVLWHVSKTANIQETLSVNEAAINTISKSETALSTDIIGNLGLQVSFTATHNSVIPEGSPNTKNTDYTSDVTLLYNF
jgi:putative salt-induced outer membrane protein